MGIPVGAPEIVAVPGDTVNVRAVEIPTGCETLVVWAYFEPRHGRECVMITTAAGKVVMDAAVLRAITSAAGESFARLASTQGAR